MLIELFYNLKLDCNNDIMVATRGQTGSDGPATSTPSSAPPLRHIATLAPTSNAGAAGRNEGRTTSADLTGGAIGGNVTTQVGVCAKATQANPATRSRLPWLPTDEETETEPEDMYSQGDRLDPHKDQWHKVVGGAVSGTRWLISPRGSLVQELDCCEEGANDHSRQYQHAESRSFRLKQPTDRPGASATVTRCGPEDDYYSPRDP